MRLIGLEKFEIYDGTHMYGRNVTIFYLQGSGFIDSSGEFNDNAKKIAEIKKFLRNPVDPRIKYRQIEIKRAVSEGITKKHAELIRYEFDPGQDCYLRVVGEVEISDRKMREFFEADKQYKESIENREQKLKSLTEKVSES